MNRSHPLHAQSGISLVEVLISLVIGLLLSAGVIRVFASSQASNSVIMGEARLTENSRYALDALAFQLRLAGLRTAPAQLPGTVFSDTEPPISASPAQAGAADTVVRNVSLEVGGVTQTLANVKANTDALIIRYEGLFDAAAAAPDTTITDCSGNTVERDNMATDVFYIAASGTNETSAFSLYCKHYNVDDAGVVTEQDPVAIAGDIRDLEVMFGEDSNGDTEADRLVAADAIAAGDVLVSAQVMLTIDGGRPLTVTDLASGGGAIQQDLQRSVTRTVSLRNLMR